MARRTLLIIYIATYLLIVGTIIRYLTRFDDFQFWPIALSMVYLGMMFSEPLIFRRNRLLSYLYLFVQIGIISTISILRPSVDFWTALFFPLILHVMYNYPQRTGFLFTGLFTVIMAILMLLGPGPAVGIPLIFINSVVYFLIAAFIAIIREAETSNEELRRQQTELQAAHQQLRAYTTQAEELAVLQERNRLARELHDSVTQSLHSTTLLAEAGQRVAGSGDIERARGYLIRVGEISQQALREMRLLVYELRPLELRGVGFVGALQHRLDTVERRSGVEVQMSIEEELELPSKIEEELYRIAMEALNNALKHANPTKVTVNLRKEEKPDLSCIELTITDDGIGFDPDDREGEGGLGLVSMRERIQKLGGELTILSEPGEGTKVRACVNLEQTQTSPDSLEV
jgi:signal transduction histidine kinase